MTKFKLKNYNFPDNFGDTLGYKVVKVDLKKHTAETVLKVRDLHLSPAQKVHGGAVAAFFDFALGAAVFTTLQHEDFCSTVELKVNYLRPIDLGDFLTCKTSVIFRGKKLCVVHGFVYKNKEKAPVAMATATFNIVSKAVVNKSHPQKGATGIPRTIKARSK